MKKSIIYPILTIAFMIPLVGFSQSQADIYDLVIENDCSIAEVKIHGMGKAPGDKNVFVNVEGKKNESIKVYSTVSEIEGGAKLVQINHTSDGTTTVKILKNGVVIGGPWSGVETKELYVDDREFKNPWNTEYHYFFTDSYCDIIGNWEFNEGVASMRILKQGSIYSADILWFPSGDKFKLNLVVTGFDFNGNWKHTASGVEGTLRGQLEENCQSMQIQESTGNFNWSDEIWTRNFTMNPMFNAEPIDLSGEWFYNEGEALVNVTKLEKNDYEATINVVSRGISYKVSFRLLGNLIMAFWRDETIGDSGTFTGVLFRGEDRLAINIFEATGPQDWEGLTWYRGRMPE